MRFDQASQVEQIVDDMRLADLPRASNRAVLDKLYSGFPTYDDATAEENGIQVNKNFLEGPNLIAQGRKQWNRAMLGPGNYFTVTLDSGAPHKRREWSHTITRNINRMYKREPDYMEYMRGMGGTAILHGIAPAIRETKTDPFITQIAIADLMIPSDTRISFKNLDHFAIWRQLTPAELYKLTNGPKVDPGWNMEMVDAEIKAAAANYNKQAYAYAEQYQPEKILSLIKQDLGFWGSDAVPTIDFWDFYFRESEDGSGWYRRCVMYAGLSREQRTNYVKNGVRPQTQFKKQFLYTSGKRKYANSLREILHCQFADTSPIFPQYYHEVRSLGFLNYGVCELQNRIRCKFSEAVLEQLMWFFRAGDQNDFSRLKKAIFSHMGVIPNNIAFVTANERFKPDHNLINLALEQNRQLMSENAAGFTEDALRNVEPDMKATVAMLMAQHASALLSSMLNLAYTYEEYQYRESSRRCCLKNSKHPKVKKFQLDCLKEGVPSEMLDSERWDISAERVLGGGNKTLEIAQVEKLLAMRPTLDPDAQQTVDHMAIEAYSDDPALAERLKPTEATKAISDARYLGQIAYGTLLQGNKVDFKPGLNHIDYAESLLEGLEQTVQNIEQRGGNADAKEVLGLLNVVIHLSAHIKVIAQDRNEAPRVKGYGERLAKIVNQIKMYSQQLAEQKQNGNGQPAISPEELAKIQAMQIQAEAKAANSRESHAQKTAQRQVSFEMKEKQAAEKHQLEMATRLQTQAIDNRVEDLKAAAEIRRERMKSKTDEANVE